MTTTVRATWTPVCLPTAVPLGEGVAALLPDGAQVALFRTGDAEFHALSNVDPFSGAAVLARGILGDAGGIVVVASPIYKQRFELATGRCLDDESVRVAVHPVRIRDGVLCVGSP